MLRVEQGDDGESLHLQPLDESATDLANVGRERAEVLPRRVGTLRRELPQQGASARALSEEERRNLRALGYGDLDVTP